MNFINKNNNVRMVMEEKLISKIVSF